MASLRIPTAGAAALAAVIGAPGSAAAQAFEWTNPAGGSWHEAANWDLLAVPSSGATARFTLPGAYQVLLRDEDAQVRSIEMRNPDAVLGIGAARQLTLTGPTHVLDGTLVINDEGLPALSELTLLSSGPIAIVGTGEIVLVDDSHWSTTYADLDDAGTRNPKTIGPGITIRGSGWVSLDFSNTGTVRADAPGRELQVRGIVTNTGVLEATDDGVLLISSIVEQVGSGRIVANGGRVRLAGDVRGGGIIATGGVVEAGGDLTDITLVQGDLVLPEQGSVRILDGMTMNGTLHVTGVAAGGFSRVYLATDQTLSGAMTIALNEGTPVAIGAAQLADWFTSRPTTTLDTGVAVRGSGVVSATLINRGVISADQDGAELALTENDKDNRGRIEATAGGLLRIQCDVTQSVGGLIINDGGSVRLIGSVIGGRLDARGGPIEVAGGNASLERITLLGGQVGVQAGRDLTLRGDITSDGVLLINRDGGPEPARAVLATSGSIRGAGEVRLHDAGAPTGAAQLVQAAAGLRTTIGPGTSITGRGRVSGSYLVEGALAPGGAAPGPIGTLEVSGEVTLAAPSRLRLDLAGPADPTGHDRLTGDAAWTLGGTLEASAIDGYEPGRCDTFTLLRGSSIEGVFDALALPATAGGVRWSLAVVDAAGGAALELRARCTADADGDCELSLFDFLAFQNLFDAGDPTADLDGDGALTIFDFLAFQNAFDAGCP